MNYPILEELVFFALSGYNPIAHHRSPRIYSEDDFFLWFFFWFFTHPRKLAQKMLNFYLIWSLSYVVLLWLISQTWKRKQVPPKINLTTIPVALLIPFRNEEENLRDLTTQLKSIVYPDLEIILIDDHSQDQSYDLLQKNFAGSKHVTILKNPGIGKKNALEFGLKHAKAEIILTTDSDCNFTVSWIENIVSPFSEQEIQLVAGPVLTSGQSSFFKRFQQIEWASILLLTQYFFAVSKPVMCSAANLAYRRSAFLEVNGYEGNDTYLSGDDEFLLKKIARRYGSSSCKYLNDPSVLVQTKPMNTWSELINQRIRWASKWKAHSSYVHVLSAVIPLMIQLIWMLSLLLLFYSFLGFLIFLFAWTLKIISEKQILGKVLGFFSVSPGWIDFFGTSWLHPIFVIWIALGTIRGKFTWKGRDNLRSVNLADKIIP